MNQVFMRGSHTPLTPEQLANAANAITERNPFFPVDFQGPSSRIQGTGHCACGGNGEFELLPPSHPDVKEGQKRYMICRKCGCYSHL